MDLAIKTFFKWHLGEFRDVKKHCILYPTKSLIFCKSLLFFQNKARIANSLWLQVYLCSFYVNVTKIGTLSYHCRFTQSKPDKESQAVV